jgi:hypothetical protein
MIAIRIHSRSAEESGVQRARIHHDRASGFALRVGLWPALILSQLRR